MRYPSSRVSLAISRDPSTAVNQDVGVDSTALVPSGEDGGAAVDSLAVDGLDTTEPGEAVSSGLADGDTGADARVNASGIGGPDVDIGIRDGVASIGVDELDVQEHGDTGLSLAVVLTDRRLFIN